MSITYYATKVTLATGIHVAAFERALQATAPGNATDSPSLSAGTSGLLLAYTTGVGDPNLADWGNGTYRADFQVSAAGANMSYGVKTVGAAAGHFARVDNGLTSDLETAVQAEATFTGTGLKSATVAWNPSSGAASDRFEVLIAGQNTGTMSQSVTFDSGAAGTTMGGAFDAAAPAAKAPPPRSQPLRVWNRRRAA
jgi:hypothetical protein